MPDIFDQLQQATVDVTPSGDIFDEISMKAEVPEKVTDIKLPEEPIKTEDTEEDKTARQIAKELKFFGKKPSIESIKKARRITGVGLKKLAGGMFGTPFDIARLLTKAGAAGLGGLIGTPLTKKAEKGFKYLPTSENVEKFFDVMSGEKFEPKTTTEKLIGHTASGLGAILGTGGPLAATKKMPAAVRTFLGAFAPAAVITGTEKAGAPPWMQAASSIGASLLVHRFTGKTVKDLRSNWYKKAEKLAKNKSVDATSLNKNLNKLNLSMAKGGMTGPKKAIQKLANEVKGKIYGDRIDVEELIEFKRNINERMGEFEKIKGSKGFWKQAGKIVDQGIGKFEKFHPEFKKVYRDANSLHKGMQQTKAIESFIKKHPILGAEMAIFAKFLPGGIPAKVLAVKGGEIASALIRNPGLRKAYWDILKNASKSEVRGTLNALRKFNKEVEEKAPDLFEEL